MKKRNRAVIFAFSTILTIGVLNYNHFENKANATTDQYLEENNKIHIPVRSVERQSKSNEPDQKPIELKTTMVEEKVPVFDDVKKSPENAVKYGTRKTTKEKEKSANPETRVIDGYTYVNIMDSTEENLAGLIDIAKKHNAALYAIEYSDSFAMYSNDTGEPLIMFSTGSRSVSIKNAAILFDMHPSIKEQIKTVIDTGKETVVKLGEFESYHISLSDGRIHLSF